MSTKTGDVQVGCRNFSYLPALHAFRSIPWSGVELDAYARYWSGVTRAAYAQTLARHYFGCRYHAGSLLEVEGSYDLIIWFLPFVVVDTLTAYGLPRRFFAPEKLLSKAYELLSPGGTLFIVNQGRIEYEEQQRLCREGGFHFITLGEVVSPFSPFHQPRFAGTLAKAEI